MFFKFIIFMSRRVHFTWFSWRGGVYFCWSTQRESSYYFRNFEADCWCSIWKMSWALFSRLLWKTVWQCVGGVIVWAALLVQANGKKIWRLTGFLWSSGRVSGATLSWQVHNRNFLGLSWSSSWTCGEVMQKEWWVICVY